MTDIEMALTPISQAQRMLAEAKTLPELRELRDYATGAKAWAKARGIGIGAENEATEVIVRAEREIGRILVDMRERGLISDGNPHLRGSEVVTTADLVGFSARDRRAHDWMVLARIADERFESMIAAVRGVEDARLSKANFYAAIDKAERKRSGADEARPTAANPDFDTFRRGAYGLLGWDVDEDGVGSVTKNGLTALPDDELRTVATIIKSLAFAYNEAKALRG
jgi:hypothetical protein